MDSSFCCDKQRSPRVWYQTTIEGCLEAHSPCQKFVISTDALPSLQRIVLVFLIKCCCGQPIAHRLTATWASYQIRKMRVAQAPECRERFPRRRLQRKPLVSDPDMHHGTCVTPWCMSGSLTRGGRQNVPIMQGSCTTSNFAYLERGPLVGEQEMTGRLLSWLQAIGCWWWMWEFHCCVGESIFGS